MTLTEPEPTGPLPRAAADARIALFLDFDGTLVEIAPAPDAVKLDQRVGHALDVICRSLDGALALVSGRPVSFLDKMLAPYHFDIAGLHGAQVRLDGKIRAQAESPDAMREAVHELVAFASSRAGIIVEDKRISAALHWQLAPQFEHEAIELMRALAVRMGPGVRLQEGKAVAELLPAGASKGNAISWLMQSERYSGRTPVFIGDDITDEAGFAAVNSLGGLSIRVGEGKTCATRRLASPTDLRTILLAAADSGRLTASSFLQD